MGKFDKLVDMPSFPEIFTYGGDEKLPLDPVKGHNLHFIKPYVEDDAIIRSSCTSSPPTQLGYNAAKYYYDKLALGQTNVEEIMQGIRQELKRLYELPQDTGIFLTPSGTDAQLIPILVAKCLNPGNDKLLNIVTGKGEIGSRPLLAAAGKFFSV